MAAHPRSNESDPLAIVVQLARRSFVSDLRQSLGAAGVARAVAEHDSPTIFNWVVSLLPLQGISDAAAMTFQRKHGEICWAEIETALAAWGGCSRLRCWWSFQCGYRKAARTCANPNWLEFCALPRHDLRKGSLNVAAYGLHLVIRDVCDGDVVAWIDHRLAAADRAGNPIERGQRLSAAVVAPLAEILGTGPKLWHMIAADLLLAGDPYRKGWMAAGASMIAIDTLVHNFLHRTGTLRSRGVEHAYGPSCYRAGGCAEIIERFAEGLDARVINPTFPAFFPRLVQVAIWEFCAGEQRSVCNGVQIDDRLRCRQVFCPVRPACARLPRPK